MAEPKSAEPKSAPVTCRDATCFQPRCRRCGASLAHRRTRRAAMMWPVAPAGPVDESRRQIRILGWFPRRVAYVINTKIRRVPGVAIPKPVLRRVQRMLPEDAHLATSQAFGLIGTTFDHDNGPT